MYLLALARLAALVVAFVSTLHVGLFGWIEAAGVLTSPRTSENWMRSGKSTG